MGKGIAGIVYPDRLQTQDLTTPMLQALSCYKDVDQCDIYTYNNIHLGVLQGAFAINEKRSIAAAIEGGIQNAEELAAELAKHGCHLKNPTNSEILLHSYEHWDEQLFEHIAGEFLIVILDQRKKRLLLCRDRIGKKPLYWFHNHRHFIFGSEIKALLASGLIPQSPALDGLSSYLYFGYIPQDMTPISEVNKLLPAHYLEFHFDGNKNISSYWSYSSYFNKEPPASAETASLELERLIKQSIASSSSKKSNIGCFLSEDLGSAAIAAFSQQMAPTSTITCFTADCCSSRDAAAAVAKALQLPHKTCLIPPDACLDDVVALAWHLDEPQADSQAILMWNLAKMASQEVDTVFSSVGSEEFFAGYSRCMLTRQTTGALKREYRYFLNFIKRALIPVCNLFYQPLAFEFLKETRTDPRQYEYFSQHSLMTEKEIKKASPRLGGIFDPELFLHKFHHLHRISSTLASCLYFDVKTALPDKHLLSWERITAAHGLRGHTPLLDRHILEFLASLYNSQRFKKTGAASYLKDRLAGIFPPSILERRPSYFKPRVIGDGVKKAFSLLKDGTLVETGMISPIWVEESVRQLERDSSIFPRLWAVLLLEVWFRLFINRPITKAPVDISVEQLLREPS